MRKIHVLQHYPAETPGCITGWALDMGYPVTYTRFFENDILPYKDDFDWLIIMGGPMSIHEENLYPWLAGEKRFIESSISAGKTVLGICLGAQLIADVLGAKVTKNRWKEIGWFPVFRTDDNAGARIFDKIDDGRHVFHWHGETFEIPRGAVHGFSSDGCRNQGFLYNDRVLALQFHLEVTQHLLHEMIESFRDELTPSEYIQSEEDILKLSGYTRENGIIMYSILDELDSVQPV